MGPDASVVIACYNGEAVIARAIDSALAQTIQPIEIVVVDDGSSDTSCSVVEKYSEDRRVRLVRHGENRGISAARNTGIAAAQGAFIGFLDQDDVWYPRRLESALDVFHRDHANRVGLVFGNEETRVLATGAVVRGRVPPPRNVNTMDRSEFLCALIQCNFVPTAAALFRRQCFDTLGPLDESIKSGIDDFEMFIRVARNFDVRHVDEVQAIRHVHPGNFTKLARMVPDALKVLDRIAAEEPAVARIAHKASAHYLYLLSREKHGNREFRSATGLLCRALWWHPFDAKCWLALALTMTGPFGYALTGARRA